MDEAGQQSGYRVRSAAAVDDTAVTTFPDRPVLCMSIESYHTQHICSRPIEPFIKTLFF